MTRGEIYRTRERVPERGDKPGFYVVVSRGFIAKNEDVSTVICAPIYSEVLGLSTEVVLSPDDGVPRTSAIRCDFLTLMFKQKLTHFVASLSEERGGELDRALACALELPCGWQSSLQGLPRRLARVGDPLPRLGALSI